MYFKTDLFDTKKKLFLRSIFYYYKLSKRTQSQNLKLFTELSVECHSDSNISS